MMQVECRELGGRDGGSRRIVYFSSVSPKDGSGRSQAAADQGDLSTVQLFQISSHVDSHIQQPPHKDDLPLSISIKVFFIIHLTFKHLKAVRGCLKFFEQKRKTLLYQTI